MNPRTRISMLVGVGLMFVMGVFVEDIGNLSKLWTSREERRLAEVQDLYSIDRNIRLAVFGSNNAYGNLLKNRFGAYPYLLHPDVDVYSHWGTSNLNYISNCLESVVGDEKMYDVIILDYWLEFGEGLEPLVKRLRARYPACIMLILKTWSPAMFRRKATALSPVSHSFDQWKKMVGLDSPATDFELIIKALTSDSGHWVFPHHGHADEAVDHVANTYGASVFGLPFLPDVGIKESLMSYLVYFDFNSNLSPIGHQALAKNIKSIISSSVPNPQQLSESQIHGNWETKDLCNSWYWTGSTTMEYAKTFHMRQHHVHDHRMNYALQVQAPGWINVTNPFADNRTLYLSFLANMKEGKKPANENDEEFDVYPKVAIRWGHNHTIFLNPNVYGGVITETRTVKVGRVSPGSHQIPIQAVSGGQSTFSLVGSALLQDEHSQVMEHKFVPSMLTKDYVTELIHHGHNVTVPTEVSE